MFAVRYWTDSPWRARERRVCNPLLDNSAEYNSAGRTNQEVYVPTRHFTNVNTCVYDPSVFRVLANWPRAPAYLPVPPNIARATG